MKMFKGERLITTKPKYVVDLQLITKLVSKHWWSRQHLMEVSRHRWVEYVVVWLVNGIHYSACHTSSLMSEQVFTIGS